MIRNAVLAAIFFASLTSVTLAEEKRDCLFRGIVVPLSSPGDAIRFARSRNDYFEVRLHVTQIIAGDGPVRSGEDYIFPIHSIVSTFGRDSVETVEGKEFFWVVSSSLSQDGTMNIVLFRGEELYKTYREQIEEKANQPAGPSAGDASGNAGGSATN